LCQWQDWWEEKNGLNQATDYEEREELEPADLNCWPRRWMFEMTAKKDI